MHLIFDLDGTLVDSRSSILHSLKNAVHQVIPHISLETLDFKIGPPVREMLRIGVKTANEGVLDLLENAFRVSYDSGSWELTVVYPNVIETLDKLRLGGISCYVVTNKPFLATTRILTRLNLAPYFDIVLSPDARQPKFSSKAEMLEKLLGDICPSRDHVLYIGDSVDDFYAARQCGIDFVGIEYGYGSIPSSDSVLCGVSSFDELLSVLQPDSFPQGGASL